MRYTSQFAALLGSESAAAGVARIKSPAFAATLSNGREANGYRSVAIGTVLACILVAASAAAVWQFSGSSVRRAPEFAGPLVVAGPSEVAVPSARATAFDVQVGVSDPAGQDPSGHLSPSPIDVSLPRGALQAAVDSAPFRTPVLGIATAGLPVGVNVLGIAKKVGLAASDPSSNAALEANGADGSFAPPSSTSDYGGRPPLSSGEQGGTLPSGRSATDDSLGNGGHRESDRPNYVARFAREAIRTSAATATAARGLQPGTAGKPEADSEFGDPSDGAAGAEQDSSDATQLAAGGAGSHAASGSDDAGRSKNGSPDMDGAPNGRGKGAGGSANSGTGVADRNSGLGNSSPNAAGSDAAADTSGRNGRGQAQRGKNDNGGGADAPGRQGKEKDADARSDGGEPAGQNGGSAQSDTGRGDQGGGDQDGRDGDGGKNHGGKGHGGKDHGGKDHGGKGDR